MEVIGPEVGPLSFRWFHEKNLKMALNQVRSKYEVVIEPSH
jgi:hypothetical protein